VSRSRIERDGKDANVSALLQWPHSHREEKRRYHGAKDRGGGRRTVRYAHAEGTGKRGSGRIRADKLQPSGMPKKPRSMTSASMETKRKEKKNSSARKEGPAAVSREKDAPSAGKGGRKGRKRRLRFRHRHGGLRNTRLKGSPLCLGKEQSWRRKKGDSQRGKPLNPVKQIV